MCQTHLRLFFTVLLWVVLSFQGSYGTISNSQTLVIEEKYMSTEDGWSCWSLVCLSGGRVLYRGASKLTLWQQHPNCAVIMKQLGQWTSVHFNWSNQVKHRAAFQTVRTHYHFYENFNLPKSIWLQRFWDWNTHQQDTAQFRGAHFILKGPVVQRENWPIELDGNRALYSFFGNSSCTHSSLTTPRYVM